MEHNCGLIISQIINSINKPWKPFVLVKFTKSITKMIKTGTHITVNKTSLGFLNKSLDSFSPVFTSVQASSFRVD